MAPTTISHRRLFRKTLTILNVKTLYFFAISLLFLPLTISFTTAIQSYVTNDFQDILTLKTLTALITVIISTITGVSLTTYITHQAIRRKAITFKSTLKSLSCSFIPLLSTFIAGLAKLSFISIIITLFGFWFHFKPIIMLHGLMLTILYHIGIWGSAPAIIVMIKSRSGFESISQSENQSFKFRFVSCGILFYTIGVISAMLTYNAVVMDMESLSKWFSVVYVGVNYVCSLWLIVNYVVMNTVLYVQCHQVAHGEAVRVGLHGGFSYVMYVFIVFWLSNLFMMGVH